MPTSTLLQLVARGRQDAYLTSNPQMTFFKQVYRRYTPYAVESIPMEFDGTTDFGRRISLLVPRKADLLGALFLEVDLPPLQTEIVEGVPVNYWVNNIGHVLINDVSIEIGEQEIDKQTGMWLNIWGELTTTAEHRDAYYEMIGHWADFPSPTLDPLAPLSLTIPLRFWFCNSLGAALPLIALQAHPVRIIIHLNSFQNCVWNSNFVPPIPTPCPTVPPVSITRLQLFGDYIFLEKEERQRFAAAEHEYLIDQVQIQPPETIPAGVPKSTSSLQFNLCCKEFIWVIQENRMQDAHEWFNFSNRLEFDGGEALSSDDQLAHGVILLDGYDRFYRRNARFFRLTQPYQHHTAVPGEPYYIYIYSFSAKPEDQQPSGSLNASKINDIQLHLNYNTQWANNERTLYVFAPNYNILRIVGGLGGLAFIS
jgi:hypothetical protein